MVKRVYFLLFLIGSWCSPISGQVFSIDSVEVSILIPEHHKTQINSQQDTLSPDAVGQPLDDFIRLDSLLAEKHFITSGRIKIKTNNYYNQLVKDHVLKLWVRSRLFSGSVTKTGFNPWGLSLWWNEAVTYKPFALSLKYRERSYDNLMEFPSVYSQTAFQEYLQFLEHPSGADTLIHAFSQSPVKSLMQDVLFEQPFLAQEVWDSIPEPPKLSFGAEFIQNRSANESIEKLLHWEEPETKRQLEKKDAIQRTWTYGGTENIQVSQAFQENWVKGGENSISLLSDLRLQARYKKNNVEWESYVIHKLGILNTEDKEARFNDDLIELNSKYGLSAGKKWFYSGLINFKTQLFNGYESSDENKENPVSGFMAPGYLTLALGMDYKEKNFTLMLLPVTSKMTIVSDTVKFDQTRYDIPEDKKIDNMGGASLVNSFKWELAKDFNLQSKMDFFYEYMRSDNQIQAEWELILDMKINVFLSTRIGTYLRYYSNESEYVQFRENLSISFNYRF